MTINYDEYVEQRFGARFNGIWWDYDGTYITPEGQLFDVDDYTRTAHCCGFVIPFFITFLYPHEHIESSLSFDKEKLLQSLLDWEKTITTKYILDHPKAIKMRLDLVRFFINCYKSKHTVIEKRGWKDRYSDLSKSIGQSTTNQGYDGHLLLKEILVRACDYDSIESQLPKTITTSKFDVYKTFYDYLLMDFNVYQIPKKVYDESEERYVDYAQSEFLTLDSEFRLKDEIQAIKKLVPINNRHKYFRGNYKEEDSNFYY